MTTKVLDALDFMSWFKDENFAKQCRRIVIPAIKSIVRRAQIRICSRIIWPRQLVRAMAVCLTRQVDDREAIARLISDREDIDLLRARLNKDSFGAISAITRHFMEIVLSNVPWSHLDGVVKPPEAT